MNIKNILETIADSIFFTKLWVFTLRSYILIIDYIYVNLSSFPFLKILCFFGDKSVLAILFKNNFTPALCKRLLPFLPAKATPYRCCCHLEFERCIIIVYFSEQDSAPVAVESEPPPVMMSTDTLELPSQDDFLSTNATSVISSVQEDEEDVVSEVSEGSHVTGMYFNYILSCMN